MNINLIMTGSHDSALCTNQVQDRSYGNGPPSWISVIKHLSIDERKDICQRAMSAFLENSTKSDFYGAGSWSKIELIRSWTKFRNFEDEEIHRQSQKLVFVWYQARRNVLQRLNIHIEENLWSTTCANLWSFCLAAGCPKAERYDAFKSLETLRDSVSRQFAYTVDLHRRISDLTTQIILQQRMITALAYREVLENLSANTPGNGEVKRWHAFLETMFKAVEKGKNLNENPFTGFFDQDKVDKKHELHHVKKMAEKLYSTLTYNPQLPTLKRLRSVHTDAWTIRPDANRVHGRNEATRTQSQQRRKARLGKGKSPISRTNRGYQTHHEA